MPIQGLLNDWYRGNVSSDEDGKYRGTGFGAALLKPFVDEQSIESGKQQGAVKRTITAAGENPADYDLGPGATTYDAAGAVATKRRERTETAATKAHERSTEMPKAVLKGQATESSKVIAAGDRRAQENMTLMQQQMQQSDKRFYADKADSREARADDLMFRRETMERQDARADRADRKESIQRMMAGIASLGAAFAV